MGLQSAGGVKSFSVGICDGAPSTARSSFSFSEPSKVDSVLLFFQESSSSDSFCNVFGSSSAAVDDRLFLYVS